MSKSHIAYGPKDAIGTAVAKKLIPTNCLVITKVDDPTEEAELLYFDKDYVSHQISTRHVFDSVATATTWVGKYHCVGRHIVAKDDGVWRSYIVGDNNELIVTDGSDKVSVVTAGNASIEVNGTTVAPTLSVKIDPEAANGLAISENGLKINLATDASAGAMSAMDKFKLDEIEAGAQVNTITDIGMGRTNGTISVNGTDVPVKGLGSAAFTDSEDYTPAGIAMSHRIVEELPDVGTTGTIYLIPNSGGRPNIYDEYLYVDGSFELIGTTETDLSNYYTKQEAQAMTRSEIDAAVSGKADTSALARVATTGSYNDLADKPVIANEVAVTKRNDGYYYPDITYNEALSILESGQQLTIHWPENRLVYQCVIWRSTSSSIFFGVIDDHTYRLLRWNSLTGRVEEYSNTSFALSADLSNKVDKVSGKALSTNDYTNAEKDKLAGFGSANLYALKSDLESKVSVVSGKGLSTNDYTTEEKEKLAAFGAANTYALKSDMSQLYEYKGSVASQAALPNSNNEVGDVYNVEDTGMNYAWDGTQWDSLGATYQPAPEIDPISNGSIDTITGLTDASVPIHVSTAASMTDTSKIYVYTGSEQNMNNSHWYYHNGTAWTDGGVYGSTVDTDTTLSITGKPADAKVTGDELTDLKSALNSSEQGIHLIKNNSSTFHVNDLSDSTGDPATTSQAIYCETYFDVAGNTKIHVGVSDGYFAKFFFYDNNKTFIANSKTSIYENGDVNVYANAKYFRFSVKKTPSDSMVVSEDYDKVRISLDSLLFQLINDIDEKNEFQKDFVFKGYKNLDYISTDYQRTDINNSSGADASTSKAIACEMYTEILTDIDIFVNIEEGYYAKFFFYSSDYTYIPNSNMTIHYSGRIPNVDGAKYLRYSFKRDDGGTMTLLSEYNKVTLYYGNVAFSDIRYLKSVRNRSALIALSKERSYQNPITFLHYSDIHNDTERAKNLIEYYLDNVDLINDVILTGDITNASFTQYTGMYADEPYNNVLLCIGNHDVYDHNGDATSHGVSYDNSDYWATNQEKYTQYFSPSISNWGVIQPENASTNGYCYYYKDYPSSNSKVRLIVLDAMAYDNTQHTWFSDVLDNAKTGGLAVVVANHFIPLESTTDFTLYDTGFSSLRRGMESSYGVTYLTCPNGSATDLIDAYILGGGEFVCWLCGHMHYGHYGTLNSHPNQIYLAVEKASIVDTWEDTPRNVGDESENLCNLVSIDTTGKLIKVLRIGAEWDGYMRHKKAMCINYSTRTLISSY